MAREKPASEKVSRFHVLPGNQTRLSDFFVAFALASLQIDARNFLSIYTRLKNLEKCSYHHMTTDLKCSSDGIQVNSELQVSFIPQSEYTQLHSTYLKIPLSEKEKNSWSHWPLRKGTSVPPQSNIYNTQLSKMIQNADMDCWTMLNRFFD